MSASEHYDAIVVGGGFYGCAISIYLAQQRGFRRILLLEREAALLQHASYNNQARVHNGYHYPRSFITAYRSRINLPRFVRDWPEAVKSDFSKVYAIARNNSKVTARQFVRFCNEIGAVLEPPSATIKGLFESRLIEDTFMVQEYAFDSRELANWARHEMAKAQVEVILGAEVECLERMATSSPSAQGGCSLSVSYRKADTHHHASTRYVFNCTYSGLNQFKGGFVTHATLKHEITEMALMQPPPALANLGVTVMDGPFFSMMPFPARGLHTLSHVRYTPHMHWFDEPGVNPYERLQNYAHETRVDRMVRDTARYMPAVLDAKYIESLFEIKTVLRKNEGDDGRPIFFERHADWPGCFSVLGGKIDNIYDILEKLDNEPLVLN
jgi:FAD dependent oxidoreductase